MQSESQTNEYAEMVGQAEAAVRSVKDPELRRVAFEKILETLLGSSAGAASRKKTPRNTTKKTESKKEAVKPAKRGKGPKGRLLELIEDGYFDEPRTLTEVKSELADRGFHVPVTSLSTPLMRLTQEKKLRRQKQSTGGKAAKSTYVYSNW